MPLELVIMELRPALMPPALDEIKVQYLAKLAARLDGENPGCWEEDLAEFNRVAETALPIEDFQGIYGAEEHETWVRRLLFKTAIHPGSDVTRSELVEVVRRAMSVNGFPDSVAYMEIFDANVPLPGASNLIFYPLDYDPATNTWGNGKPMCDYDPSPEQIVDWALTASESKDRL